MNLLPSNGVGQQVCRKGRDALLGHQVGGMSSAQPRCLGASPEREGWFWGIPVRPWGEHAGFAGIGLGWKTRLMVEANTADLAVAPQSPVSHLRCSLSLFGSCWRGGRELIKPQGEGLQVVTIPLPSHPGA